MQASQDDIHGLGLRDNLMRLRFGDSARIGELREVLAVDLQVAYILFGRDQDDHGFPAFLGLAGRDYLYAVRFVGQRAVVFQNIGVVVQHTGRANVVSQHVARRGDRGGRRQMIDERAREFRLGDPLLLVLGEDLIHGLTGGTHLGDSQSQGP